MSSQNYYVVFALKKYFSSLEDAKWYLKTCLLRKEAKQYLRNSSIDYYVNDNLYSSTPINVDFFGHISFGLPQLVIPFKK